MPPHAPSDRTATKDDPRSHGPDPCTIGGLRRVVVLGGCFRRQMASVLRIGYASLIGWTHRR